jgi:hypothetical protein
MCIVGGVVGDPGNVLRWDPDYYPNKLVGTNTQVYDAGWTRVSNKPTTDRAAIIPIGDVYQVFEGTYTDQPYVAKQIIAGQRYAIPQDLYIAGYTVDAIAGNKYDIYTVLDPFGLKQLDLVKSFTAQESGLTQFNLSPIFISSGTAFDFLAFIKEPDPTPTTFNDDWDYAVQNNVTSVGTGQVRQDGQDPQRLLVSKTSTNLVDRSAELAALGIGDTILAFASPWAIQATPIDGGAFFSFIVAPAVTGSPAGITNFVFETTVATPITIGQSVDYWVPDPNVQGLLGVDQSYGDIVPDQTARVVDIRVQQAYNSPDWDTAASSDSSSGSVASGRGYTGNVEYTELGSFFSEAEQLPTGLGLSNSITITYGAGGTTSDGSYTVLPVGDPNAGKVLCNKGESQREFDLTLRIGREGAGGESEMVAWLMYAEDGIIANAVQSGFTFTEVVDNARAFWRVEFKRQIRPKTGSILWVQLARNNLANDSGGLYKLDLLGDLATLNPSPSAALSIGYWRTV